MADVPVVGIPLADRVAVGSLLDSGASVFVGSGEAVLVGRDVGVPVGRDVAIAFT